MKCFKIIIVPQNSTSFSFNDFIMTHELHVFGSNSQFRNKSSPKQQSCLQGEIECLWNFTYKNCLLFSICCIFWLFTQEAPPFCLLRSCEQSPSILACMKVPGILSVSTSCHYFASWTHDSITYPIANIGELDSFVAYFCCFLRFT